MKRPAHKALLLALAAALALSAQTDGAAASAALDGLESKLRTAPDDLRLGSEYRQTVIRAGAYDRAIEFLDGIAQQNPKAPNAFLNLGFAYVDKIATVGSITQVILAERSLESFTKSVELEPRWLNLYTRGNSYLFWPAVFGRAPLGVEDLERAMEFQRAEKAKHSYYVRTYISLGDGYWKTGQAERARKIWREGLEQFPGNEKLVERMKLDGEALDQYLADEFDPNKRVDTSLRELWESE